LRLLKIRPYKPILELIRNIGLKERYREEMDDEERMAGL